MRNCGKKNQEHLLFRFLFYYNLYFLFKLLLSDSGSPRDSPPGLGPLRQILYLLQEFQRRFAALISGFTAAERAEPPRADAAVARTTTLSSAKTKTVYIIS